MANQTPDLLAELKQERLDEAQSRLLALDKSDFQYQAKKMIAESRVSNLLQSHASFSDDGERMWRQEEALKSLQDKDEHSDAPPSETRPKSSDGTFRQVANHYAPYNDSSHNGFGGHFASDGIMADRVRAAFALDWDTAPREDTTASETLDGSVDAEQQLSSNPSSSPETTSMPHKRRRIGSHVSSLDTGSRSTHARPAASPPLTGTTTPGSLNSHSYPDDIPEEMFALFGGDPKAAARELRESRLEQEQHDRMIAARREQERLDEEFALSLQNEDNPVPGTQNSFQAGPSARPSTQTHFNPTGSYNRPLPYSSSPPPKWEDPFAGTGIGPSNADTRQTTSSIKAPMKVESTKPTYAPPSASNQSAADFIVIDSDEDDHPMQVGTSHHYPSNDLMAASSQGWHTAQGSSYPSNAGISGNGTSGFGQFIDAFNGVAQNIYEGAANLVYGGQSDRVGMGTWDGQGLAPPINVGSDSEDDYGEYGYLQNLNRMGIDPNDPANRHLANQYRDRFDYLTNDPTRTAGEIKTLLENIRPDEDLPPQDREGTPAAMTYPLMEHQKLGLAWMKRMEEGTNRGGILADDMGLGKTIQALALMASKRSSNPDRKTTLIVAPVALLKQWEREIQKKLKPQKEHRMSVHILHGSNRQATWEMLKTFDVVLTTFGILTTEVKRQEERARQRRMNPNWRPTGKKDQLCLLGDNCHWYRVIIDEAQCMKNKNTRAAAGACRLRADTRFCMTGTPMMNNVGELFSLIQFLRIKPYCDSTRFSRDIARPIRGQSKHAKDKAMRQLQALLKSILLRRTKTSEIDGKPILNLPKRITEQQHAPFDEDQAAFYRALETRTQLQFNRFLKAGTVGRNYSNILVLLLRLRQACCHPHLIKDFGQSGVPNDISADQMIELAKELAPEVVNRIKDQVAQNEDSSLECPVCMDMAENATIFIPCGHDTCSECFARITDPATAIADGDAGDRSIDTKCPNCRGKVTPNRVIDFSTFKKVHMPELCEDEPVADLPEDASDDGESSDSEEDSDEESDEDGEVDIKGNLKDFIVDDDADESTHDEDSSEEDTKAEIIKKPQKGKGKQKKNKDKGKAKAKSSGKGKGKAKEKKTFQTLAELKRRAGTSAKARRQWLKLLEKDWISSTKIDRTLEILRDIQARPDPNTAEIEKTIIFSQFTSLLDLLEVPIHQQGWGYQRYDGSMNPKERNNAVIEFTDNPRCQIMLVSLKAGNSGLNLTAASHVVIFDPFWNPFIEEQAIDRAHRIGQQKEVHVHRMLVPNTVEDRIIALQESKRQLIEQALDEKESAKMGKLGIRELAFLFVSFDFPCYSKWSPSSHVPERQRLSFAPWLEAVARGPIP